MLNIEPYVGVSKYTFGLTQPEIASANGEPFKIEINNILKHIKETRKGIELTYVNEKLVAVYIKKTELLLFKNIDLFNDIDVIEKLKGFSEFIESDDKSYILFKTLGLCLGGFSGQKIPEGKLVIAFSTDRLAHYERFINV